MSLYSSQVSNQPLSIDGLITVSADEFILGGNQVNLDSYVTYSGATQSIDLGTQTIRTTHVASNPGDLVNKQLLDTTLNGLAVAVERTFLDRVTTDAQTVTGPITATSLFSFDSSLTSSKFGFGKVMVTNSTGVIVTSSLDNAKLDFLSGVTADIQTQLNGKLNVAGGTMSGPLDLGSNRLNTSYVPAVSTDVANKSYVDTTISGAGSLYVLKTGSTMSGNLVMQGNYITSTSNPTTDDQLTRKGYVDGQITQQNTVISTKADKTYVDTQNNAQDVVIGAKANSTDMTAALNGKLSLTGGSLSGALTVEATVNVNTRLLGKPDGISSGNFWMGLRGTGTELERLAISIEGPVSTGVVSGVTIAKPLYLTATGITANRVPFMDGDKILKTSAVTYTELLCLSNVTGPIQSQINVLSANMSLYVLKSGETMSGTLFNSAGDFHAYKGGDTNRGCILFANNADGGTLTTYNGGLASWFGIGFKCTNDSTTRFIFNTRDGTSEQTGKHTTVGVDSTDTIQIGLASNTKENIKFSNTKCHIDTTPGEAYLFTAFDGHIAVGRNTNRDATTANLCLGVADTEESQIISVKSDNSGYMPMSFAGSVYSFTNGNVGIGVPTSGAYRAPPAKLTVNSNYSGGDTGGFCINAYDGAEYNLRLYPYVQGSGQVAYQFKVYNLGTAYNSISLGYNGSVGIGTTIPGALLDIYSTTADYTNSFQVRTPWASISLDGTQITSGRAWTLLHGGPGAGVGVGNFGIYDETAGAYRLAIDSSGNVGIGIQIPSDKLTVNGNGLFYGTLRTYGNGAGGPSAIYSENATTGDGYAVMFLRNNNAGSGCYWFLNSSTRTPDGGPNTATLRNDTGTLRLQSSGAKGITIATSTGNVTIDANLTCNGNSYLLSTGVGTYNIGATYSPNTLSYPLCVDGYINGLYIESGGTVGTGSYYAFIYFVNTAHYIANFVRSPGGHVLAFNSGGYSFAGLSAGTMAIDGNGYVYTYSDRRVKNTIQYFEEPSLDKILRLKPCSFKLNQDPYNVKIGFIAQDVEEVIPDAVDGKKHEWQYEISKETGEVVLDEDGQLKYKIDQITGERIPRYRGLDTTAILAHAVKAIQEQQAQIETLTQRNQILEEHARKLESDFGRYRTQTDARLEKIGAFLQSLTK